MTERALAIVALLEQKDPEDLPARRHWLTVSGTPHRERLKVQLWQAYRQYQLTEREPITVVSVRPRARRSLCLVQSLGRVS